MAVENEIRLGQSSKLEFLIRWGCLAAALWIVLFILPGCDDGTFARLQAEAEFNQKMARATTPHKGELVTVKQISEGHYIVRRYNRGLKETYVVARED